MQQLPPVSSTLLIPLAARALGGGLFPQLAVDDLSAKQALQALGEDGQSVLQDRRTVYGILSRTRWLREQARGFLQRHPEALVLNLGCGLSDYVQWLDNGRMQMLSADLAEVIALRRRILPTTNERCHLAECDLSQSDWWKALKLPDNSGEPLFILCEGVLMYLPPAIVAALLRTFAERAPRGSQLAFDASCWLAAGKRQYNPSVRKSGALFQWGPRRLSELTAPHPRLKLLKVGQPIAAYGMLPRRLARGLLQAAIGVPLYGLYLLGLRDSSG